MRHKLHSGGQLLAGLQLILELVIPLAKTYSVACFTAHLLLQIPSASSVASHIHKTALLKVDTPVANTCIAMRSLVFFEVQVVSDAVYSRVPSLRQAGMEFTVWVFKHGAAEQLEKAAPDILRALWAQLEDGESQDHFCCSGKGAWTSLGFLPLTSGDPGRVTCLWHGPICPLCRGLSSIF